MCFGKSSLGIPKQPVLMGTTRKKRYHRTASKQAKGRSKFATTPGKRKRGPAYENHGVKRISQELAPCDDKRKQKINLRTYTDSKGKVHYADINFNRTTLTPNGRKRKQTNYAILEFDYVNRELGVVAEIDGVGHQSGQVHGDHAFLAGRENDIIKELYCEAKGWILVRISNMIGGNVDLMNGRIKVKNHKSKSPYDVCGFPEFNRRIDAKLEKIRRRLGRRAPQVGRTTLKQTLPCTRRVSKPSTPLVGLRKVESIVRPKSLERKMLGIISM